MAVPMVKHLLDRVVIIYNPMSTGNSESNARKLRQNLQDLSFRRKIILRPTEYSRHAEKIAKTYARRRRRTLLISSSGDGGYHELINGILQAPKTRVIAGLLPSGNANDHFSAVGSKNTAAEIMAGNIRKVDVLKMEAKIDGKTWVRYAHSYIGIGISPLIGRELNRIKLNVFNEKIILLKQLLSYDYDTVVIDGVEKRLTSLIFANIPTMSKVLTVAKKSRINDGKFEVNSVEAGSKPQIFLRLFQASTLGLSEQTSTDFYKFRTIEPLPVQLDGEVYTLDGNCDVTVSCLHDKLSVII